MRKELILAGTAAAMFTVMPLSAVPETRESYLSRLAAICDAGCMPPRQLLRTARKRGADDQAEIAGILDVAEVTRQDSKYLLHQQSPNLFDLRELGFDLPQYDRIRIENVNAITIELDEQTARDLLNMSATEHAHGAARGPDGGIIVEGDRDRRVSKPSLEALEDMFRNRRIVVRGTPRIEVPFTGARLNRRQTKLTIMVDGAANLVLLPRYDKNGEPILDGPLSGLGASLPSP